MIITRQSRACDVCRILDFDVSQKICGYCSLCDAWICQDDQNRWDRRIKAAILRKLEPGYSGHPEYEKLYLEGNTNGTSRTGTNNQLSSSTV
jgi:hypothetical protein